MVIDIWEVVVVEDFSVIAVVVTYNRKNLLLQTLAGLKKQTRPLDRIVVVDNASTDGTAALLKEKGVLGDDRIQYVRSEVNTGGAGGFHAGMECAIERGADWIWVMDDDVAPTSTCLAALLRYRDVSECIHPKKFYPDGREYRSEQFHDILTGGYYGVNNLSFKNGKTIIFTNTGTFEGMLISRRLVDVIGLPDKKYFICGDDMLFAIKASVHTHVCHVSDAVIHKLLSYNGTVQAWKSYYWVRNRFFLFRDACDYLGLKPHRSERAKFVVLQILESLRLLTKGSSYLRPVLSGFAEGFRYMKDTGHGCPDI